MSIKNIIENPHPVYTRNIGYWNFLLDSYEGGADYTGAFLKSQSSSQIGNISVKVNGKPLRQSGNTNLFEHPKELSDNFHKRVDMSYYYNFCAPVIDIYTDHIFKQSVDLQLGSIESLVEERAENIDQKGSTIEEYRKQVAESMQIFGHTFTLVDSPMFNGEIFNLQDKMDNGIFPYFTNIQPQSVINWSLDRFGKAYWVMLVEVSDANANPDTFNHDQRVIINYRLWTRQEWILYDDKYNEVSRGFHGLGFVPISVTYDRKSKKQSEFLGVSFISDISFIARDIYNKCSELNQILRDQTFSILAIQGDAKDYPSIEVATNRGLLIPKDSIMPAFITPPAGPAETLMKHIDSQVSRIFQMAKLEGGSVSKDQSAVEQSGVSKAWDFNQTNSALSTKSSNMQDAEFRAWQMWAKWEGKEFDGSVAYPREFSVNSLKEDLNEAEQIMRMNISNEFTKLIKVEVVKKKFPQLAEKDMKEIEAEIEAFEPEVENKLTGRFNQFFKTTPTGGTNGGKQ